MLKKVICWVFLMVLSDQAVLAQLPDFTDMVKTNGVAVVNISTVQKVKVGSNIFPQIPGFQFDLPNHPPVQKQRGNGQKDNQLMTR